MHRIPHAQLAQALSALGIDPAACAPLAAYDTGESYTLPTAGEDALALWWRLRAPCAACGRWPVLLGDAEAMAAHQWQLDEHMARSAAGRIATAGLIAQAMGQPPADWFRARARALGRTYRTGIAQSEPPIDDGLPDTPPDHAPIWRLASDPYSPEAGVFHIPTELVYPPPNDPGAGITIRPAAEIYLALLPTGTAWHVPAYLALPSANDVPDTLGHLQAWRWWQQRHRAEIVGVALNGVEAWAAPRRTPRAAARLAWERQVYCPDADPAPPDDGGQAASVWSFWWH